MQAFLKSLRAWSLRLALHADTTTERRRWFLKGTMLVLVLCSLVFCVPYQPEYDHRIHLLAAALYGLLFVVLQAGVSYVIAGHLFFLVAMFHVVAVAIPTGGINSPAMVWMTVVPLPAIMLLNRTAAIMWAVVAIAVNLVVLDLTQRGVLGSFTLMSNDVMAWVLMNKVLVVCLALGVVYLADFMRRQQTAEIEASNQALEQTYTALRQAQAHKEEFVASVGHELRTPMNAILGLNGILRAELADRPEDTAIVDHIRRSTEQLLHVVNNILDFSQLQAGQLSLMTVPFDLHQTVHDVLAPYQEKMGAKGLGLDLQADAVQGVWVSGDRQRLAQILDNLLDNAWKFTAQGRVVVRVARVEAGVRFEVEDSGIGIPVDSQQQVFDRFEFADLKTNRQYGGTGLGLSISERLVSLQGGRIGVNSTQGQGSCFWFELPLSITSQQAPERFEDLRTRLKELPIRILLVDDNAVNLLVERMLLQKYFHRVQITEAMDGAQALDALKAQTFDVVLMDMVMPGMDGLEATRTLRQQFPPPLCDLPVLGLTASASTTDMESCMAAGMNDVLHKPMDETQVVMKIASVLQTPARSTS